MHPPSSEKRRALFTGHRPVRDSSVTTRLPRRAFQTSIIYRQIGGLFWYKGTVENASSTGMLFRGEKYVPVDTTIEVVFTPPGQAGTRSEEDVFCWGKVVRTMPPSVLNAQPALATKIMRHRPQAKFLADSDTPFKTSGQ
jgi:hypothetical protein